MTRTNFSGRDTPAFRVGLDSGSFTLDIQGGKGVGTLSKVGNCNLFERGERHENIGIGVSLTVEN